MDGRLIFAAVDRLLSEAVTDGVIPGFALCIRTGDSVRHSVAGGSAELRPEPRAATTETAWDVASLTKVLATTPIAMTLVADGVLALDTPIRSILPACPRGVTIGHLLSHSSGAAAWTPFIDVLGAGVSAGGATRSAILERACEWPLEASPGTQYRYSDIGFLMLCAALERVCGERIDTLFQERVVAPSGAKLTWGHPEAAATEDCPIRNRVVVGEVHDLNAWLMGGVSSHAGLFGTAEAVAANAAWQLRSMQGASDEGLSPEVVARFIAERGAGSHRMGWDGVSPGGSAGPLWPANGFGHLAFTGCSIWVAPDSDCVAVLLTNRVHPTIEGGAVPNAPMHPRYRAFRALRKAVHSGIATALGLAAETPTG